VGNELPLHCTAIGKTILAHLPPEEVESVIASAEMQAPDACHNNRSLHATCGPHQRAQKVRRYMAMLRRSTVIVVLGDNWPQLTVSRS
jgi:DNA-binding IclR family transcriptional regulator